MAEFSWSNVDVSKRLNAFQSRLNENTADVEHVFTQTFFPQGATPPNPVQDRPLSGAFVSVKDLFDVAGFVTRAGSKIFATDEPAAQDAEVVQNLRNAGATIVGHTNMTELAYSGLGLNPHYGTPRNALLPDCIPGGSTSGGAISVATGLVDIAIGTDTGGSLRIPAAFNGIVGFKPSQSAASRKGCKALSRTLDSVGPMARTVRDCRQAYEAMRNGPAVPTEVEPVFTVPTNFGFDDIDPIVQSHFDQAVTRLKAAGFSVCYEELESLEHYKSLAVWQFSAVESRAEYEEMFQTKGTDLDPRVRARMARADVVDAVSFRQTLNARTCLVDAFHAELGNRVLLMPTTPILPPRFSDVADDAEFGRLNLLALRNPSVANVMDACSISLPMGATRAPSGLMLTAGGGCDDGLLDIGEQIASLRR